MARPHLSETGRLVPLDPGGPELERAIGDLVGRLQGAHDEAARHAGRAPLGVRAVEVVPGSLRFLCAFEGPGFLCLVDGTPARAARTVRETATAGLTWEHVESLVDADRLSELAVAAGRVLALTSEPPRMVGAVEELVEALRPLSAWRLNPLRACASVPQLDIAAALQDRAHRAFGMFVAASDHLVEAQDTLGPDLVAALRGFEEAAGRAGVGERLADVIGGLVPACDRAADEVVATHLTPLGP